MQYSTLISQIEADIYSNGMELITGDILQNVLKDMVSALAAAGACYGGAINTGSAAPADLDQATFYLATEPGEYTNYVDSNNDPLIIQGPSLIVFDGGASLVFSAVPLTNSRSVLGTSVDGDNGAIIINVGDITYGSASVIVALQGELTDSIIDHASAGLLLIKADDIAGVIECTAIGDTDQVTGVDLYNDDGDHLITVSLNSSFDYVAATVVSVTGFPVDVHTAAAPEGSLVYTGTVSPVGAGAVRYDQAQTLSAAEQAQARDNIAASGAQYGVISQTQTWSGSGSNPRTYVMSGQTTGLIPQSFIDMAVSAGATFNPNGYQTGVGYFELNGLTDISYAEMRDIMSEYQPNPWTGQQGMLKFRKSRTNIPPTNNIVSIVAFSGLRLSYSSANLEILKVLQDVDNAAQFSSLQLAFYLDSKLRIIEHALLISSATNLTQAFDTCYSLEEVRLKGVKASVSFGHCSLLSKDSLLYLINNEASTGPITITLHADVYAKTQSGGDWYADVSTALDAHPNISLASA